jgi:hypothetical protein
MISYNEKSSDSAKDNAKENRNTKYKTDLCNQDMTKDECEMALLQNAVSESEALEGVRQVNEDLCADIGIVEDLSSHFRLCLKHLYHGR